MARLGTFVIFGIVLCVTQPITIIANLLTIIAFMKVPSLQTHTSNLLIFALSIVDMISGIHQLVYNGLPLTFGYYPIFDEIGCMMAIPIEYTYAAGDWLLVAIIITDNIDYRECKYEQMTGLTGNWLSDTQNDAENDKRAQRAMIQIKQYSQLTLLF